MPPDAETAEVVDLEPATGELVRYEPTGPITLFGTSDPRIALKRMSEIAKALIDVVRSQKLAVRISGREHLTVEAWRTLGGMLGVVSICEWSRALEDGTGWEARVVARTLNGRIVGAAESMCTRAESTWAKRDEYALRGMAETRATSRALRGPLGQIVVLAGYEPAGAEEIPSEPDERPGEPVKPKTAPVQPMPDQKAEIGTLLRTLEQADPETDWRQRCHELARAPWKTLTRSQAAHLIEQLRGELAALMPADEEAGGTP
jgi:hypothetical protein